MGCVGAGVGARRLALRWWATVLLALPAAELLACSRGDSGTHAGPATRRVVEVADEIAPARGFGRDYDLIQHLHGCDVFHYGLLVDLGTRAADTHRAFALGPLDDTENSQLIRATVASLLAPRVDYDFWLDTAVAGLVVSLRAGASPARKLGASVDGVSLGSLTVPAEPQALSFRPLQRELKAGRHLLTLRSYGKPPSHGEPYASVDWLRFGIREEARGTYAAPVMDDIVARVVLQNKPRRALALRPPSTVRCPLHLSAEARLDFALGFWGQGQAHLDVRVVADGEPGTSLFEKTVGGGDAAAWIPVSLDLGAFAGRAVALELRVVGGEGGGRLALGEPRVSVQVPPTERTPSAQNVVIVVASGLDRSLIPPWTPGKLKALAGLVKSSAIFEGYRVPSPLPSAVVASLLTGMSPISHTVTEFYAELPGELTLLSELLKEATVRTAMFTGVPDTFGAFGFNAGWDRFAQFSPAADIAAAEPLNAARVWLEQQMEGNPTARRFVLVHVRGGHPPWDVTKSEASELPPDDYDGLIDARRGAIVLNQIRSSRRRSDHSLRSSDWTRLRALQEAALVKQDQALGRLVDTLTVGDQWRRTMFVFMGDVANGDPSGVPFEPTPDLGEGRLLAPLLVKWPADALAAEQPRAAVTSMDITKTVLETFGVEVPAQIAAENLYRVARGDHLATVPLLVAQIGDQYSARSAQWLLKGNDRQAPRLCQMELDPACANDVMDSLPLTTAALWRATYNSVLEARSARATPAGRLATIDPVTAAALSVWGR